MKRKLTERQRGILCLLVLHLLFAVMVIFFDAYLSAARGTVVGFCALKEIFHLYCPFCGGTRAFGTLFLRRDLLGSLAENAMVFLIAIRCALLEITAFYAIVKKKDRIFVFAKNEAVIWVFLFTGYFVLRNVALYGFHFDPLGDFFS